MTPGEVAGLQALARAHGQTLTINPETGLPEAFSLKSLLPMIAGAGLSMIPGVGPVMAAGLVGGGTALATGSLQKGLMAGLGAYGGAGIGGALSGAGAVQGLNAASAEAAAAGQAEAAKQLADANMMAKYQAAGISPEQVAQSAREFGSNQFTPAARAALVPPSATSNFDNMVSGFKGLGTEAGRSAVMEQMGGLKGLGKYGLAALSPLMMSQSEQAAQRPTEYPHRFEFDAGATGAIQRPGAGPVSYFNPRLRQMAEGGSTGMTGQSDEYYRYLMGLAPSPSAAYAAPVAAPAATQADTAPLTVTNPLAARRDVNYSDPGSMAFDDPNNPQNPNAWGNLTPLEQAQFYSMNSGLQKASGFLQDAFGRTALGAIQNYFVPGYVQQQKDIVSGKMLNDYMQQYDHFGNPLTIPDIEAAMANAIEAQYNGADNDDAAMGAAIAAAGQPGVDIGSIGPSIGDAVAGITDADVSAAADAAAAAEGDGLARGGLSSLAFAQGGYNLGDYSDGGRLLRGPGDGVSDSIPASIANKRPARLADGEFVVPARIVSELGNGSTEAGARQLYAMMDRIQRARKKSVGKGKVAVNSRASKLLPA